MSNLYNQLVSINLLETHMKPFSNNAWHATTQTTVLSFMRLWNNLLLI